MIQLTPQGTIESMKPSKNHTTNVTSPDCSMIRASQGNPVCSVAEAANRLGKSRSTVYRLRFKPGPIQFVRDGRRVYVDLALLEEFLARTADASDAAQQAPSASNRDLQAQLDICALESAPYCAETDQPATPSGQATESSSCGQRDLIFTQRRFAYIATWLA